MRQLSFLLLGCILLLAGGCYRSHAAKVARPPIITAVQWGSHPQAIPADQRHVPHQITVHHAGVLWREGDDPVEKLTGLQSWGWRERGWPDVPYHYLIAPDGRIFEGRPADYAPQTNTDYDTRGHIGVQLWGNFEEQSVTIEQLRSTVQLIAWLCDRHVIPPSTISGHRDVATGTVCPGEDLQRYVDGGELRVWVAEMIAGREPQIQLISDDDENRAAQPADGTDP